MEGEKRGVEKSSLGGGGSWSAWREPPASHRLLTTFSHMENHIDENFIELWWPQGEMEFAHLLTPGENFSSDSQPERSLDYKPNELTNCAISAPQSW